jgi:hypothetical protein
MKQARTRADRIAAKLNSVIARIVGGWVGGRVSSRRMSALCEADVDTVAVFNSELITRGGWSSCEIQPSGIISYR